jgi:hypothetical protein
VQKSGIALLVILLIVVSTFGYYYNASQSSIASGKSQIDGLESVQSSLNSTITSEESQIESLQSQIAESSTLYQVVFSQNQNSVCDGSLYAYPWGVELGNVTKTSPPNATFSQGTSYFAAEKTSITFTLPNGIYYYTLLPWTDFINFQTEAVNVTGSLQVNGGNATVIVTPACPSSY